MKILGIDYGTKRIGTALSDEDGLMAFPNVVIENDNKVIENIEKIINENDVKVVVIGESKNYKIPSIFIIGHIFKTARIIYKLFN